MRVNNCGDVHVFDWCKRKLIDNGDERGKKKPGTISRILCHFECWMSILAVIWTGISESWKKVMEFLLPQYLWYKMQWIVNLSHRLTIGVLRCCCDASDRCLRGPGYLTVCCSESKQMLWVYGLCKDCFIGAKSVTCIFLFQVRCASCLCVKQSHRGIISTDH